VPRTGLVILFAIAVAAIVAAGCGSADETVVVTETATSSTATATAGSTATTSNEATTSTDSGDGETPSADETVTKLTGFSSPTGNIGCYIDRKSVRCDIGDRDWKPPRAPKSCELDWGQGIELTAGSAADFVCAGDTTLGAGDALDYGRSIGAGLLICESEESGMTCRDTETGRGFTISKQGYEIF
jgi:uncharacterized protein DUF6636